MAREVEAIVRARGATPATIAIVEGRPSRRPPGRGPREARGVGAESR